MKLLMSVLFLLINLVVYSQDVNTQLKQAENFEKQQKEDDALAKYKEIAAANPGDMTAIVKCAELSCSIGGRQKDKNAKDSYYTQAATFADEALALDSNSADANYAKALVADKMAEIESENKKVIEDVRQIKQYADRALAINPDHAKANYLEGKWHYEMLSMNWFKKAALKTLYKSLPKADIDSAIAYMEKCRKLDQYFVLNYLDLAKAYRFKERPAQAIEVLTKMVRLPTRTEDDVALKAEGKKMLEEMQ